MILRDTLFQADIAIHWGLMHGFSTHGSYITEVPVEMHHLLCSPRFEFQHSVKTHWNNKITDLVRETNDRIRSDSAKKTPGTITEQIAEQAAFQSNKPETNPPANQPALDPKITESAQHQVNKVSDISRSRSCLEQAEGESNGQAEESATSMQTDDGQIA